ncbi:hypothetical protein E2L08_05550 [Palleronia sediminis]|uniref:Uncharacterized protein n=1 Tax=Palleronia sediminis TaxID=2547833 RepID=A0A4R6AEU0_9RHOB|nr:hypothetical protein [Palleronia sediminis]TDL81582.1 hypothetical protein E2L08_05550 [Palleronia sediminis]
MKRTITAAVAALALVTGSTAGAGNVSGGLNAYPYPYPPPQAFPAQPYAPGFGGGIGGFDWQQILAIAALLAAAGFSLSDLTGGGDDDDDDDKDKDKDGFSKRLPVSCLHRAEERHATRTVFGAQCLSREYRHADRLPDRCRTTARVFGKDRRAYDARCLRDRGYRVARH